MSRWQRFVATVGAARFVSGLGLLFLTVATVRFVLLFRAGRPVDDVVATDLVIALPGILLLYGGYRLPSTDVRPDVYPRIVSRCVSGFGLMLVFVGLLAVTGLNRPTFTPFAGTALGSVAGFGIGLNEARALSRAADAEQRNRELTRYETLIEETTDVNAILDVDGTVQYVTPSVEHVLGYDRDELIGENAAAYIHPDDSEHVAETFINGTEPGERSRTLEFRFRHADGSWVVLEGRSRNLLDDPAIEGIVAYTHDMTEHRRLEDDLRRARDLRERIFETSPTGILVIDADGTVSFVNAYATELLGVPEDEIGEVDALLSTIDVKTPDGSPAEGEVLGQVLSTGDRVFDVERRITPPGSQSRWISINGSPLRDGGGEVTAVVVTLEDVTERKQYQDRLVALNQLSHDLSDVETEGSVADLVVETASDTLPLPLIAVGLYDDEGGQLHYSAQTAAVADLDDGLFASERGLPWRVFSDQTQAVYDDLTEEADVPEAETRLRSAMILPLGDHGVFVAGATTREAFSDIDVSIAQMLVATTRSALDRVDRERTVREQRDTLAERNEVLERVQRINSTIRGITTDLIRASTREEIVQAACDRLTDEEAYRFAWIGHHAAMADAIEAEAWAGDGDGFLDAVTANADETDGRHPPSGAVVRTRTTQVRNNLAADPPFEPWEQAALDRGFQASIAVPLVYQDTLYGVLAVYADEPDVFNQMEEAVLTELGTTIGYTLSALERRQALVSDQSVELEFELRAGEPLLFRLASEHDCEFEFENIVRRADGPPGVFFTVRGASPDEVLAFGADSPEIDELTLVSDRDGEALFEARLHDSTFISALLDRGAMPRTLRATGGEGSAVLRVPRSSNIRTFVELFETRYEVVELVGRREVDEPIKTQQEFDAEFRTRLTERQEEILKTAYVSGFFEWPREMSAQDLAEQLGVSQPTVSRHIRAGERKLFELVFDEE